MFDSYVSTETSLPIDETLNAFMSKEKLYPASCDYLDQERQNNLSGTIKESWRELMCEWAYEVVDHYNLERNLIIVAFNYLDRFLSKLVQAEDYGMRRRIKMDERIFQLSFVTCLCLSMKLHMQMDNNYRYKIHPKSVMEFFSRLSRGLFSEKDIKEMERCVLSCLGWLVHPTTSTTFIYHLFNYLPLGISPGRDDRSFLNALSNHAHYLSELVVVEYSISNFYPPSEIALACILCTISTVGSTRSGIDSDIVQGVFLENIKNVMGLSDKDIERVQCIRYKIYDIAGPLVFDASPEQQIPSPVSSTWIEGNSNKCKRQKRIISDSG